MTPLLWVLPATLTAPAFVPAEPLTTFRVASLPADQRAAWAGYLEESERRRREDETALAEERRTGGDAKAEPDERRDKHNVDLTKPPAWYAGTDAARIADHILSYQAPCGGWSKNVDMGRPRRRGERFTLSKDGGYVATFDNDATVKEIRFLARVATSLPEGAGAPYRAAALRCLDYVLAAQYPNGGWPQVYPLMGGYHDGITYNDGAMLHVLRLLEDVAGGDERLAFVPADRRERAAAAFARGLRCILDTQVVVDGRPTVWAQQHDPLTLRPASARNFEMAALSAQESAGVLRLLMDQPRPDAEVVRAVTGAASWLEKNALRKSGDDRWARFYEIGTDRPLFGDRDKSIHYDVDKISKERREGYSWFGDAPEAALAQYAKWKSQHSGP